MLKQPGNNLQQSSNKQTKKKKKKKKKEKISTLYCTAPDQTFRTGSAVVVAATREERVKKKETKEKKKKKNSHTELDIACKSRTPNKNTTTALQNNLTNVRGIWKLECAMFVVISIFFKFFKTGLGEIQRIESEETEHLLSCKICVFSYLFVICFWVSLVLLFVSLF